MTNLSAENALAVGVALFVLVFTACGGKTPTPHAPEPSNTAPEVAASAQLTDAAILNLSGSVLDETVSNDGLTVEWTQVSGPAPVVFADASQVATTAAFTIPGTYVLRLTASDGEFSVSDDVTVVVQR